MNFNTARRNMLLNQVRTWDFISPETINIMQKVQREEFVPVEHRKIAFCDYEIPLANDEFMMKPILEGRILQSLNLDGSETVLEIGTGSGYMTALLSHTAKHVTSIDIYEPFTNTVNDKLSEIAISNCECLNEDIFNYQPSQSFDCIVATGSFKESPDFLLNFIKPGGKVFAIVGNQPNMTAMILRRDDNQQTQKDTLFETVVKPLKTTDDKPKFTL